MKKPVILTLLLLSTYFIYGQFINNSWFPSAGDLQDFRFSQTVEDLSPGNPGLDQVWDFSLANNDFGGPSSFELPEDMQNSVYFPEANLGWKLGTYEVYYRIEGDTLKLLGTIGSWGISYYTDQKIEMISPWAFGESYSFPFTITKVDFPTLDTTYYDTRIFTYTFDAVGTVITPIDTFENCYRIATKITYNPGTEEERDFLYSYEWYQGKFSNKIAFMGLGSNQEAANFQWNSYANNTVAIQELEKLEISIKHLSEGQFQLLSTQSGSLEISLVDLAGRILFRQEDYPLSIGKNRLELPVHNLPSGLYVFHLLDKKNQAHTSTKFTFFK